ncbi:MAG: aminopeptidase P family protein, partial [Deltaproteobacteria bacterium]|nr:aminopeptidase P family protein [Deltaproteobacteria bacterium]
LIGELKPGASEQETAWRVAEALHARGVGPAFPPLVASGPNASKPHAVPTGRPLQAGEPIIIDVGAKREGYCSDITRTVCLGQAGAKFQEVYRIVRQAQLAAIEGIKPGMKTDAADHLARRIIEEAGFGQAFGHSLGHGVGLAVHEAPSLSPLKSTVLAPGMVTTIEPAIYLPGWGGVRLEVMLLITETGAKLLGALDRFYDYG